MCEGTVGSFVYDLRGLEEISLGLPWRFSGSDSMLPLQGT